MRVSAACLSKGFWGRSLDELRRATNIAVKFEGINGPTGPYSLFDFSSPESIQDCKAFSDKDIHGFSTANLDWVPPSDPSSSDNPNAHARFHGSISLELPTHRPDIQRTGYAAWRTLDRKGTIFGRSLWNIDPYVYLALRIKSDGRSYFVNVQTESVIRTDLHQHRLFARRPGQWETVLIRWSDFVRTNHGFVVEPQTELLRQKVKTIGIGLTDRVPGPFELCIERLWATNDNENENDNVTLNVAPQTPASEPEAAKAERPSSGDNGSGEAAITRSTALGGLKNKDGQAVKWTAGRT